MERSRANLGVIAIKVSVSIILLTQKKIFCKHGREKNLYYYSHYNRFLTPWWKSENY